VTVYYCNGMGLTTRIKEILKLTARTR